jgi:glycosyltransferase involved in cell wall biosynthesis
MTRISVVIITLNEEKNLPRCLNSVKDIADEILVVDSFSIDKTKEIAVSFGARFIQHKFENYVNQHDFADQHASHNFILTLDADEALSGELQKSIRQIKDNPGFDGFIMNRITNYCGKWIKHSGWYPDKKLRLYDRRKGRWAGQLVHERFELHKNAKSGFLKGDILHYSFYTIEEHIQQANKFSTLGATALASRKKSIPCYYLVMKPVAKFIRNYFFRLGFLDGFYGYTICYIAAAETFYKYAKARHMLMSGKEK